MIHALRPFLALTLLFGAAIGVDRSQAAEGDVAAERQRIETERRAVEARFEERRRDCEARFVVTGCLEEAQRERREAMSRLKREQNALDDRERKTRASEHREEIRKREEEKARRAAEAGSATVIHEVAPRSSSDRPRSAARQGPATDTTSRHAPPPHDGLPRLGRIGSERSPEEEARSRENFDAAQRAAAAHRAEVEARNARRGVDSKPSAPLPLPPGASSP